PRARFASASPATAGTRSSAPTAAAAGARRRCRTSWSLAFTERGHAIDDARHELGREVVAPAGDGLDLRTGHQLGDVAAALDRQQRVFLAVQDEGRRLDGLQ